MSLIEIIEAGSGKLLQLAMNHPNFYDLNKPDDNANNALHVLATKGQHKYFPELIARGLNVNAANRQGRTPLHLAIKHNHLATVTELINHGANVNQADKFGWSPLFIATLNGSVKCVQCLYEKGAHIKHRDRNGESVLHVAARCNHQGLIAYYMKKKMDINGMNACGHTPLGIAIEHGNSDIAMVLMGYNADTTLCPSGSSLLHAAVRRGDVPVAEMLLKTLSGRVVDEERRTPLHLAAECNCGDIAQMLIRKDADVNAPDADGYTPFHVAVQRGHLDVVRVLLANEAINHQLTTHHGDNALHLLAGSCLRDRLKMNVFYALMQVDLTKLVTQTNCDFRTALHYANEHYCRPLVLALMDMSADVDEIDRFGRKPMHYCVHPFGNKVRIIKKESFTKRNPNLK